MARTRVTINGKKVIDANLDQWQQRPPEFIAQFLQPGAKPEPVMRALLVAMMDAAAANKPFHALVNTFPDSWTLKVRYE